MIRIFVPPDAIVGPRLTLQGIDARHLGGSLRIRSNEEFIAVTGDGVEHRCLVLSANARRVEATVVDSSPALGEASIDVRVCVGLLKGDQLDRIVEYCSEVGVEGIQPLETERTIPQLSTGKVLNRMRRWTEISRYAAELAQRGRLPKVLLPAPPLEAAADARAAGMQTVVLYEGRGLPSLSDVHIQPGSGVCLLVGPEGGWSDREISDLDAAGAAPVTLGPRIMRPLPAILLALGVVYHRAGELSLRN